MRERSLPGSWEMVIPDHLKPMLLHESRIHIVCMANSWQLMMRITSVWKPMRTILRIQVPDGLYEYQTEEQERNGFDTDHEYSGSTP